MHSPPPPISETTPTENTITEATGTAADAVEEQIDEVMEAFNHAHLGDENEKRIVLVARDAAGGLAGAAVAWTCWDYLYLENLWVSPQQRGRGTGARLLQAVEAAARQRRLRMVQLYTFSFEAPHFYRKQGYTLAGQIDDAPAGTTNHWFYKIL